MAQSKLNDLAGKFGKGGPPGIGIGLKLLGVAGALAYGATHSVYTGKESLFVNQKTKRKKQQNKKLMVRNKCDFQKHV